MDYTIQKNNFSYSAVKRLIEGARDGDRFIFEKGRYDVYEEDTFSAFYYESNCDAGNKHVAFYFRGLKKIAILGNGSRFVFHGRVSPFIFDGCRDVTVQGLEIDYDEAYYVQGVVTESASNYTELELRPSVRYGMKKGFFVQKVADGEVAFDEHHTSLFQAFDTEKKRVLKNSNCRVVRFTAEKMRNYPADKLMIEEVGTGRIRIYGKGMDEFSVGCTVVFYAEGRNCNTVFAVNTQKLLLKDFNIYYTPSMGVVCQFCEDVTLCRVNVILGPERHGMVSANADATHFINCAGTVRIKECMFENMLDDGANIHGIFTDVKEVSGNIVTCVLGHFQQYGINPYRAGDTIAVYRGRTLAEKRRFKVASTRQIGENLIELILSGKTELINAGDQIENVSRNPVLLFDGCTVRNNRPRGVLVATNRKAVVKNCYFSTSGAGVEISANNHSWFESGGITDLTIKDNVFEDCCHQYGAAAVAVFPLYDFNKSAPVYYCQNIKVTDNEVVSDDKLVGYVLHSKNVQFARNEFRTLGGDERSTDESCVYREDSVEVAIEKPKKK